ncbi:ABC transporter permease [Mucilaginibacter sp. Bleaf8]|uniref:ABC transporter permease n=1 Tax=Mucilaginibacter sp. Bleaf8 TaxID=2834430 RepID=UPI001BCE5FDB|nr:ABC transporter permease [Mucilaginibacter sp. Bleaf8]MBS7567054.1 ABC transporter permease [Mucilaginibacter sp. Bleaf8]
MLENQFKIACRNVLKNKGHFAINVFGLAVGLATCLMISLFVMDELSYDQYNENANRIYRINNQIHLNGSEMKMRTTPAPMAAALLKDYPEVEQVTRIRAYGNGNILIRKGTETLLESNAYFADSTVLHVFNLHLIAGDAKTALSEPGSMVISASMANMLFNTTQVIGKVLRVDNTNDFKITGVIEDMPAQSHLHFNFLKSMAGDHDSRADFWLNNNYTTYVLLRKGTTGEALDTYLAQVAHKYVEPQLLQTFHSSMSDLEKNGDYLKYAAMPLTQIHLLSEGISEQEPGGNIVYVYTCILIAAFILLIACVNFINLSTARSAGRAKEVGVRKVLGADRLRLIVQFLTESVLTSLIAMLTALLLVWLFLPCFNQLAGKHLTLVQPLLLPMLLLVTAGVGVAAGLYPAFFLSAFEPVQVLKGRLAAGFKNSWLRNGLVVFQFSTAIILIVCTLIIYNQLNYVRNKDLGYNRDQVLVVKNAYALGLHASAFKHEVLQLQGVVAGTRTGVLPTSSENDWNTQAFSKDAAMNASQSLVFGDWNIDTEYLPAMGIKLVLGRNFSANMPTDSNAVLINETAARMLGFQNPLRKTIYDSDFDKNTTPHAIIGVVKDFSAGSVHQKLTPIVFRLSRYGDQFAFRVHTKNLAVLITQIKDKYHAMDANMAGQPFLYSFMDDDFNKLYQADQRTGKIFITFAFFALLIASLGLFGLITYAAEQRTKEIGIRKVLGASVASITAMLSFDFIKLVLLAVIIGSPLAWLGMQHWLQGFAYRTTINIWTFVIAAIIALLIALSTLSYQVIKAALANPVKSLRSE